MPDARLWLEFGKRLDSACSAFAAAEGWEPPPPDLAGCIDLSAEAYRRKKLWVEAMVRLRAELGPGGFEGAIRGMIGEGRGEDR